MAIQINSNVTATQASRNAYQAQNSVNKALQKLSTGLRINQAKDGPADLIISELLRSQMSGTERAIRNTQEASNVLGVAEGGLNEVSAMLNQMRQLAIHSMNSGVTSGAQTAANQAELNSALSTIGRIVDTTSFSNQKLLNGARDFTYSAFDPNSILDTSASRVDQATTRNVSVSYAGDQSNQAEKAYMESQGSSPALSQEQSFTITGANGSMQFTFAAGTTMDQMAEQINSRADSTGVNAYAIRDNGSGATQIRLVSQEYGADASVRVEQRQGDLFAAQGSTAQVSGQNATLTVNGQNVTTNGLTANVTTGSFSGSLAFQAGTPTATTIAQTGYDQDTLTNATAPRAVGLQNIQGGMQLQLGDVSQAQERFSIGNFSSANLGRVTVDGNSYSLNDLYAGGAASLAQNPELATKIIDQAIKDVSDGRARIGSYQSNALQTNANSLAVALENLTATESYIRDTDMATGVMELVRARLMTDVSLRNVQSANMMSANVAKLLGIGG